MKMKGENQGKFFCREIGGSGRGDVYRQLVMSKVDLHIERGQKPGCIVKCVLCTAVSL